MPGNRPLDCYLAALEIHSGICLVGDNSFFNRNTFSVCVIGLGTIVYRKDPSYIVEWNGIVVAIGVIRSQRSVAMYVGVIRSQRSVSSCCRNVRA